MISNISSSNRQLRAVRDGTIPEGFTRGEFEKELAKAYREHINQNLRSEVPAHVARVFRRELDWLQHQVLPWPGDRGAP